MIFLNKYRSKTQIALKETFKKKKKKSVVVAAEILPVYSR